MVTTKKKKKPIVYTQKIGRHLTTTQSHQTTKGESEKEVGTEELQR